MELKPSNRAHGLRGSVVTLPICILWHRLALFTVRASPSRMELAEPTTSPGKISPALVVWQKGKLWAKPCHFQRFLLKACVKQKFLCLLHGPLGIARGQREGTHMDRQPGRMGKTGKLCPTTSKPASYCQLQGFRAVTGSLVPPTGTQGFCIT